MTEKISSGIQVISRAAAILREVSAKPDGLSLGQLASATGLARSTVQRIVDALELEFLVQGGTGGVRPGWGLRRLGEMAGPGFAVELRPQLFRLFEATGETVDLSTLVGGEVLFMDRFLSERSDRIVQDLGGHYPAYTMANGKALLAQFSNDELRKLYPDHSLIRRTPCSVASIDELIEQLDLIRAGGYAYDIEEHEMNSCAIGLPIVTTNAQPLAVSVVVPIARYHTERARIEQALRVCAHECQIRLQSMSI